MDDSSSQTLFKEGLSLFKSGEIKESSELFFQVVERDETNHKAWNALGVALTKLGDVDNARVCFENALNLDSDNEVYLKNLKKTDDTLVLSDNDFKPKKISRSKNRNYSQILPELIYSYWKSGLVFIGIIILIMIGLSFFSHVPPDPEEVRQNSEHVIYEELARYPEKYVGKYVKVWGQVSQVLNEGGKSKLRLLTKESDYSSKIYFSDDVLIIVDNPSYRFIENDLITVYGEFDGITNYLTVIGNYREIPSIKGYFVEYELPSDLFVPQLKAGVVYGTDPKNKESGYIIIDYNADDDTYSGEYTSFNNDVSGWTKYEINRNNRKAIENEYKYEIDTVDTNPIKDEFGYPYYPSLKKKPSFTPSTEKINNPPKYKIGDLVWFEPTNRDGVYVVLQYDSSKEEYYVDTVFQYYTNEWGYRDDESGEWFSKSNFESFYQYLVGSISIDQIGIGPDSPPHTPVKYKMGDIIRDENTNNDFGLLILKYDPSTSEYQVSFVSKYEGKWKRGSDPTWQKRSYIEKNYRYHITHVLVSMVE